MDSPDLSSSPVTLGCLLFAADVMAYQLYRLYCRCGQLETSYWAERRGRTRVEREMRKIADVQLNTSEGFFVQPIGTIESCYKQCIGTPRQGLLAPSSRSNIILTKNMSPESLDTVQEFSHVWITFKFHLNTNTVKEAKAFNGMQNDKKSYTFTGKITPPMLKRRVGVLSTRSPHRPNPIGVTLARVVSVDKAKRMLCLSACDLVHGTPVLDIKPYVPFYDSIADSYVADWIDESIMTRNTVNIMPKAKESLRKMVKKLYFYKNDEALFWKAVEETLAADVRSKFQTTRAVSDASKGDTGYLPFDEICIEYRWIALRDIEVVDIVPPDHADEELAHEKRYEEIIAERLMPNTSTVVEAAENEGQQLVEEVAEEEPSMD